MTAQPSNAPTYTMRKVIIDKPTKRPHPGTRAFDHYMPRAHALNNKYFPYNQTHKIFKKINHGRYDTFLLSVFNKSKDSAKVYSQLLSHKTVVQQREFNSMLTNIMVKHIILFLVAPHRFGHCRGFIGQNMYRELIWCLWHEAAKQVKYNDAHIPAMNNFRMKKANARDSIKIGAQLFDVYFDDAHRLWPMYVRNRLFRQFRRGDIEDPGMFSKAFSEYIDGGNYKRRWDLRRIGVTHEFFGIDR